jgi:hypothetical protein
VSLTLKMATACIAASILPVYPSQKSKESAVYLYLSTGRVCTP